MAKLTIPMVAEQLGLHQATVRRRLKSGKLTLRQVLAQGGSKRPRMRIGDRYGHLTVVEVLPSSRGGNARVIAQCLCGCLKEAQAPNLKSGCISACGQCGLSRKELHGQSGTRTYQSWRSMLQRCRDPNFKDYRYYGGRGVSVCRQWQRSFAAFLRDMGERPAGMTLDRTDPDGNYTPENCRWAPPLVQARNRRNTLYIETPWGRMPLSEATRRAGLKYNTVWNRLNNLGYTAKEALGSVATISLR